MIVWFKGIFSFEMVYLRENLEGLERLRGFRLEEGCFKVLYIFYSFLIKVG